MTSRGLIDYYKLVGMKSTEKYYNFDCPDCNSKNIQLKPVEIVYRSVNENNDIKDIQIRNYLNKLPLLQDAILMASRVEGMLISDCQSCNMKNRIFQKIDNKQVRQWVRKNLGKTPLFL